MEHLSNQEKEIILLMRTNAEYRAEIIGLLNEQKEK